MIFIPSLKIKDPATGKRVFNPVELVRRLEEYTAKASPFPTIAQFCYEVKMSRSRLYDLKEKYEELSDAIELLHLRKEFLILYGGASGKMNANFAQFILKQQVKGYGDKPTTKESQEKPIIHITVPKELIE